MVAGHSNIEEEVEWDCQSVDEEHRQEDAVSHPAVVEVDEVERCGVGHQHVACDIVVGQKKGQCVVEEELLNPENHVTFDCVDERCCVEVGVGHQNPVEPVEQILPEIDAEDQRDVQPIAPEHVDESGQSDLLSERLEDPHQQDSAEQCTGHPGDVDPRADHPLQPLL